MPTSIVRRVTGLTDGCPWVVLVANLGFGLIEVIGGFIVRSQALKADALDYLGDGSITLVGPSRCPGPK